MTGLHYWLQNRRIRLFLAIRYYVVGRVLRRITEPTLIDDSIVRTMIFVLARPRLCQSGIARMTLPPMLQYIHHQWVMAERRCFDRGGGQDVSAVRKQDVDGALSSG